MIGAKSSYSPHQSYLWYQMAWLILLSMC